MAAVEVTISGVLYDKVNRTTQPVVLIGEATLTGLGVGGGPIMPPGEGGKPPHIWGGPIDPYPGHPLPPSGLHPAHPIVLPPDKPTDPPTEPPTQPADPAWSWCWSPQYGWHPAYVAGDKPRPIHPPATTQKG